MGGWDENGDPCLPFIGSWHRPVIVCTAGANCTEEKAEEIISSVEERNSKLLGEWFDMVDKNIAHLPAFPLPVLPEITRFCFSKYECYHQRYWTDTTSETSPNHPYFKPCEMMRVFSLRLSSPIAHPVNIYGTFSIRDGWEPLRNYLFKRSRNDPATISKGCSFLPLCSPCRGIYVLQYCLVDVDLWIKEEGDGSADKLLFCGYVELDAFLDGFGSKLLGGFQGNCHVLDMHYAFLPKGIETVIEVLAEAEHQSKFKFSASTNGFDDEISLYDGTFCGSGSMFKHYMAVNKQEELHNFLKMDDLQYNWTFKAGVGVVVAPEHPVPGFPQYFVMNVSFRTRGKAASGWQWSCICSDVSTKPYM
ncbi:hypothetical protein HU200_039606 [Digitaria exilis]|uniref:DUF6598 domain-containing protein n=1 Tax=Digitaria exilis TaxID=1010633 RepID=A0A835EI95_9POAL|nr:hypothetical protein HU200_039606 [Digitaria exilis]